MSKFAEIDESHRAAALAEKVKFATQSLNCLDGPKINDDYIDATKLEIVRKHITNAVKEMAQLQERVEVLQFLESELDKKLTRNWLKKFGSENSHLTNEALSLVYGDGNVTAH